jgi:hypothetical protein
MCGVDLSIRLSKSYWLRRSDVVTCLQGCERGCLLQLAATSGLLLRASKYDSAAGHGVVFKRKCVVHKARSLAAEARSWGCQGKTNDQETIVHVLVYDGCLVVVIYAVLSPVAIRVHA